MEKIKKIFVISLVLFFILMFFQSSFKIMPEPKLSGVEKSIKRPILTFSSWLYADFQKNVDDYFSEKIGFKAWWVRTYNQIELSIFNKVAAQTYNQIVKSKENWLFEEQYLKHWENNPKYTQAQSEQLHRRLNNLEILIDSLKAHQIEFLFLISPAKAHVFPDKTDNENWEKYANRNFMREYLKESLDSLDINYLDASEMFYKLRAKNEKNADQLFPQGGTHWSYYGAWKVLDSISKRYNDLMPNSEFAEMELLSLEKAPARDTDKDLAGLINIWDTKKFSEDIVYPIWKPTNAMERPKILLLSSSFGWTLVHHLQKHKSYKEIDLLYYNKTLFEYPENTSKSCIEIDCSPKALLKDKSIFILEINEIVIPELGWGFIDCSKFN